MMVYQIARDSAKAYKIQENKSVFWEFKAHDRKKV